MGCDATRLVYEQCDLSKFASIRACAKRITQGECGIDKIIEIIVNVKLIAAMFW